MKRYILVIIAYIAVTYLSLVPSVSGGSLTQIPNIDKIVHICFYTAISFLSYLSMSKRQYSEIRMYLIVLLVPIVFGGVIEILQEKFFPPRSAEWSDFLADIFGAFLGYWIARLFVFVRNRIKKGIV
ncbi:MAG: VanZ family protein [Bacteroidales bacterium]